MTSNLDFFKVTTAQFVLFIDPLPDNSNKLDLAQKITQGTGNIFDGPPTILPIPNDAPQEIPRIILKDNTNTLNCNVCINRIDLLFKENKDP